MRCVLRCLLVLPVLCLMTAAVAAPSRPNIVFLLTDDQRADTLGCMGNRIIHTPNVDRLAQRGVVFENCFVTTSICATSRASIFTGQYASRHGIGGFDKEFTPQQLGQTYPALLKNAGYYIGFIGKWGVGKPPKELFDYNRGFPGQNVYFHDVDGRRMHLTQIMIDQALEFLDQAPGDRPFCLSISFKAPHRQDAKPAAFLYEPDLAHLYKNVVMPNPTCADDAFFQSMPEFLKNSEGRIRWKIHFATPEMRQETVKDYYRLVSGVDRAVGRIVEKLGTRKLLENTVFVYTGDNGFLLGDRCMSEKFYPYELSIRVPLVVVDPRLAAGRRGTRCTQQVLNIDLAPTMLDLAGLSVPKPMQGQSVRPLLEGKHVPWRTEWFYEHRVNIRTIPQSEGVRDEQFKYVRFIQPDPPVEELYDLKSDPIEARNLVGQPEYAAALERMRQKWQSWKEKVK